MIIEHANTAANSQSKIDNVKVVSTIRTDHMTST